MYKKSMIFLIMLMLLLCTVTGCSDKDKKTDKKNSDSTVKSEETKTYNNWAENAVFYQIFVRAFCDSDGDGTGDFNGITSKVDYLKDLGIDAIWLMPMMESTTYHGYDVVDYYTPNPDYGTMEDFKNMLSTLHDNDIKVIIDYVANHTSSENAWFKEGIADVNSKYRDYYTFYTEKPELSDMSILRGNSDYKTYYVGYYDTIMPDLNYSNQEVRDDMKSVAKFWLEAGVDGFRLDGSCHIDDEDPEVTYSWWKEFTSYVKSINDEAFIVGENWLTQYEDIAPYYATMDSSFDFPTAYALEDMSNGVMRDYVTNLNDARAAYKEASKAEGSVVDSMVLSTMINNHDMDRIASRFEGDTAKIKTAVSLLFTLPGTPFIYYGDEIGQLGVGSDQSKREGYDWYATTTGEGYAANYNKSDNPQTFCTKANDGISYEEEVDDKDSVYNHYKKLIALRKSNPIMFTGDYESIGVSNSLYAYTIKGAKDKSTILVVHNLRDEATPFKLLVSGKDLYTNKDVEATDAYTLDAKSVLILKYDGDDAPVDESEFVYNHDGEYSVTIKLTLPENTPADENIYITGSYNNWNECDDQYIMERTSATTCEITLFNTANNSIEYKFTRGTWDKREQNAEYQDKIGEEQKQNRKYIFEEDKAVVNATIEAWSDMVPPAE